MRPTETMRWAGPLLPVGWDPATLQASEPPPRLSAKPARERRRQSSKSVNEPMRWAGPLPPGVVE